MRKIDLSKLDLSLATIKGRDFSIESKESGKIFLSSKKYVDKLFKLLGYRNLNVIKILEDFANKTVDSAGEMSDSEESIFIDEYSDSFVITSEASINWINKLYEELENKGYKIIQFREFDPYYYWDQLFVQSTTGTYFALYIDLCDEIVQCLSLDYSPTKGLKGIINESSYDLRDENTLNDLFVLMNNPIDISYNFDLSKDLSVREYIELLQLLGYVKKRRKFMYLTDEGESLLTTSPSFTDVQSAIDSYNESGWLVRCITKSGKKFEDVTELITSNLDRITFWDLLEFFNSCSKETSDFFILNS